MLFIIGYGCWICVVFDIGCGVVSFGVYLFDCDVIIFFIVLKDGYESQFVLECGVLVLVVVLVICWFFFLS